MNSRPTGRLRWVIERIWSPVGVALEEARMLQQEIEYDSLFGNGRVTEWIDVPEEPYP